MTKTSIAATVAAGILLSALPAQAWQITWPDGTETRDIVFNQRDADELPASTYLNLENPRVRGILMGVPRFARGQPLPKVKIEGLPAGLRGTWALFRISLYTADWNYYRVMAVFLHDDGRVLIPTANYIWEQVTEKGPGMSGQIVGERAGGLFDMIAAAAEKQGYQTYEDLTKKYDTFLEREREKMNYSFAERGKIIQKVGLANVREYRLRNLHAEEMEWRNKMVERSRATPELIPMIMIYVEES